MTRTALLTLLAFSTLSLSLATACGGGGGGSGGSGGQGAGGNASSSSSGSSTSSASSGSSSSSGSMPVASCADIGATECFSNLDCSSTSDRCQNVGTMTEPVACCVAGPRGAGKGGDACVNELDCDTAVCLLIEGGNLCSKVCTTGSDCPASIPNCISVDPAVGTGSFCAP